jgi:hypothetical protein
MVIMRFRYNAGFAFWFALTSAALSQGLPHIQEENTAVRSYPAGTMAGSKVVTTRTKSGGREVVTEVVQVPGMNGGFETAAKTITETAGIGSDSVKVKRDVLGNGPLGPFSLIQTSDTDQQSFPDGTSRTVTNTWVPDLGGRINLLSRQVQETKSVAPNVQQSETILYVPGMNEALTDTERVLKEERRLSPNLVRTVSRHDVRDGNGQWQTTETRNREVRTVGNVEVLEEETVRLLDGDGNLTLSERTITHRSRSDDSDQLVTEVYTPYIQGMAREPGSPLVLDHRVRVISTSTVDGGSRTITETEARDASVLTGPIRVVARTVETVRQLGPGVRETQRQTFALDGSGRLVLTVGEKEETKGK